MKLRLAILAAALLVTGTAAALAHAFLDHASPAVGSTVHGSPPELRLWFTEAIEPAFSSVSVVDSAGHQVDKGDKTVDAQSQSQLSVSLRPLAPGTYRVSWHVVAVDTHRTEGHFSFTVAP